MQCHATTKKGARCKNTANPAYYCKPHTKPGYTDFSRSA